MASKGFTGLVIVFWAVMMAALVRVEFFPSPTNLAGVPTEQVIRKLFSNHEPQTLNISYQGKPIGITHIEITPRPTAGYAVKAGLTLDLDVFGTPSRFQLSSDSHFDARYEMKDYHVRTAVGESHVDINGTNDTKTVTMSYDLGDGLQKKQIDYGKPGAVESLGVPGLPNFALPGGATMRPVIQTFEDHVNIAGGSQHAYLIECKAESNPAYWAKLWLDDEGNMLIVETSMGFTMRRDTIDTLANKPAVTLTGTRRLR